MSYLHRDVFLFNDMVKEILSKTILNKHKKRDEWFLDDYSLNPYQLCDFNCIYCHIRGSKYGKNMKQGLSAKINAPALLEKELLKRVKRKEYGFIALSSSTEPWMHIEEEYKLTRKCLEVIAKFKFPVHCLTKSTLILRDLNLLEEIDEKAILPISSRLHFCGGFNFVWYRKGALLQDYGEASSRVVGKVQATL